MWRRFWSRSEQRAHARVPASLPLELEFEVYGFDAQAPFFAKGRSLNVSRRGALAVLDKPVPEGSRCRVFFGDGCRVRPCQLWARVVRCNGTGEGVVVALQFDVALWRLDAETDADPAATPQMAA